MRRCSTLLRSTCPSVMSFARNVVAAPAASLLPRSAVAAPAAAAARRGFSDETRVPFVPKPVYSSYKVYKTKTALDMSVVRAQLGWNSPRVEERKYLSLKRAGGFRFTFAAGGQGSGYDWEQGQLITLNVAELGDVLTFAENKDVPELRIDHDPGLNSGMAGKVRKELILKRIGGGKPGYFFNFAVTFNGEEGGAMGGVEQRKWSIAVTEGEFRVMRTLIQQTMPDLLALNTKPQIIKDEEQYGAGAGAGAGGATPKISWSDK